MTNIQIDTIGKRSPQGKPRVYFTCHPDDFDTCYPKIRDDFFRICDCAIYYAVDETERIAEDDCLGQASLLVIPVTAELLCTKNRAMDEDFSYAREKQIPVLPIMMEEGLDTIYSNPDKFGELQYLSPNNLDQTKISYEDKLEKYLNAVLIGDELANRVRAAFSAHIFLSYRQKDRKYVNQLMRMIHRNPLYSDVAIWYDEFLTPGESFRDNIKTTLEQCELFVLLVTPRIFEKIRDEHGNETDNFVLSIELPAARERAINDGMYILAVTMENINADDLEKILLSDWSDSRNEAEFQNYFSVHAEKIPIIEKDAEHDFLIGLAYLNGIDVEVDRTRGLGLLTKAADTGYLEAMKKLVALFSVRDYTDQETDKAIEWQKRVLELSAEKRNGEQGTEEAYIQELCTLSELYERRGMLNRALEIRKEIYVLYEKCISEGASASLYLQEHAQNIYAIVSLLSKNDVREKQDEAEEFLSQALNMLSESYCDTISDKELLVIADMYEACAQYLRGKSRRFDNQHQTNDFKIRTASRSMRRTIEKYNRVDITGWLRDNSLLFEQTEKNMEVFFQNLLNSIDKSMLADAVDPGTNYLYIDPLADAEELMLSSWAIKDHLLGRDIQHYGLDSVHAMHGLAEIWLEMGACDRAVKLIEMAVQFLKKIETVFYIDTSNTQLQEYLLLADLCIKLHNDEQARAYLHCCLEILKTRKISREVRMYFSHVYRNLACLAESPVQTVNNLKLAIVQMEAQRESSFLTDGDLCELVECYCGLMEQYSLPQTWDASAFMDCFAKAHKLCEDMSSLRMVAQINAMYLLRLRLEDCQTVDSVRTAGMLLSLAFEQCHKLMDEDSEYAYPAWTRTLRDFKLFNQYVRNAFSDERLQTWVPVCAQIIVENVSYTTNVAEHTPLKMFPHNYRIPFTDYVLLTGGVNQEFIQKYHTSLFEALQLLDLFVYQEGLMDKDCDWNDLVDQVYKAALTCQEQGYAFQVFTKERRELLKLRQE